MIRLIIGCGYLGRRVAENWRQRGDTVFAVTRSPETAEQFQSAGITPLIADVTIPESLDQFPECDTVLHAVGFDRTASPSKRQVYVDGLSEVLSRVRNRCDHFLQVSSTSVYGQENGEIIDESSDAAADHESGIICRDAERAVAELLSGSDSSFSILRLSGIYGPERLLSRIESLKTRQPLPGSPNAWLNLIHVDDAVSAVVACVDAEASPPLLLVSDDRPVRRADYYEALARALNAPPPVFNTDSPARHTRGLGKRCNNRLLRESLKLSLQFPTIAEGIPDAIARTQLPDEII